MKVLKVESSFGKGWLVCHGADYLAAGATEADRLDRIRDECAEFITEDVYGSDLLPARVVLLVGDTSIDDAGGGELCATRAELHGAIMKLLPMLFDNSSARIEVHDSEGNVHTATEAEMTAEECETLSEFDGW